MSSIRSKDDVLTLLVHLGYLAYDSAAKEVYIPNEEVADEFKNAVEYSGWEGVNGIAIIGGVIGGNVSGRYRDGGKSTCKVHTENVSVRQTAEKFDKF